MQRIKSRTLLDGYGTSRNWQGIRQALGWSTERGFLTFVLVIERQMFEDGHPGRAFPPGMLGCRRTSVALVGFVRSFVDGPSVHGAAACRLERAGCPEIARVLF